ncbi:NAD(P)-dependent glycerol-3-phosphate dehydrogenase [Candidatus Sumerlaeota bacterium]|nr:NAD(P)-dependent glycerol-3-phosphate dehydrogenase [Candidatus Sumerlaeota bacterium]
MEQKQNVVILGAGTWGLALAKVLWERGHAVRLWDYFASVIEKLKTTRSHPRLLRLRIPDNVTLTANLGEAVKDAEAAVIVVPSLAVRQTCQAIKDANLAVGIKLWAVCSKGIEHDPIRLMHEVVVEVLGEAIEPRLGILTGPSHAEEVAQGLPTSVVACASNPETAKAIQQLFFQPRFRVYTHDDVLGAELGGSLKNIVAIAAGIADGMGFGDSTRAALITRSLAEIVRLGTAMGARPETFYGLTGIGDLIATATSRHSRNHQFGELLAQGRTRQEALDEVGMVVEGYNTARAACALGEKYGVDMPISGAVYKLIFEDIPPAKALELLLSREAKPE